MIKTATGVGGIRRWWVRNKSFAKNLQKAPKGTDASVLHSRHRVYQHHETEEKEGKGTGPRKSELGT